MKHFFLFFPWVITSLLCSTLLMIFGTLCGDSPQIRWLSFLILLLAGSLPGITAVYFARVLHIDTESSGKSPRAFFQLGLGTVLGLAFVAGLLIGPNIRPEVVESWSGIPPRLNSVQEVYGYPVEVYRAPIQWINPQLKVGDETFFVCACGHEEGADYQLLALVIGANLSILMFTAVLLEAIQRISLIEKNES